MDTLLYPLSLTPPSSGVGLLLEFNNTHSREIPRRKKLGPLIRAAVYYFFKYQFGLLPSCWMGMFVDFGEPEAGGSLQVRSQPGLQRFSVKTSKQTNIPSQPESIEAFFIGFLEISLNSLRLILATSFTEGPGSRKHLEPPAAPCWPQVTSEGWQIDVTKACAVAPSPPPQCGPQPAASEGCLDQEWEGKFCRVKSWKNRARLCESLSD